MCSKFESHNVECKKCKTNKKISNLLYRLLCINNFYEAMDYMLIELMETFKIDRIFTLEISEQKNIYIYKKYDKIKGNVNKNILIEDKELDIIAKENIVITIGNNAYKKIWVCIKPFEDKRSEDKFLEYRILIKNTFNALYRKKIRDDYLTEKSYFDQLTGCYNRNYFETKIKEYSDWVGIGIIVCDLDGLKQINDALGHSFGDEIIKTMAKTIKGIISREDLFFRMGGDEFVIITENRSMGEVSQIVNNIKNKFRIYKGKRDKFPISISVGYSFKECSSDSIKDTLKMADYRMYQHKLRHKERSKRIKDEYIEKYMCDDGK